MATAKHSTEWEWFFSSEGIAQFSAYKNLEDRVLFILKYLSKKIDYSQKYSNEELVRINAITFHFAVFLADAIYGSDLPYATFPALIDPDKNPFMRSWISNNYGQRAHQFSLYAAFTKIIEKENKQRKGDAKTFRQELIDEIGVANAQKYSDQIFSFLPDTAIYDIVPSLQLIQLKNKWFFDRSFEVQYGVLL